MPQIRPIADLRNANEISTICHVSREPVFITKNGYTDMVVMSIEAFAHARMMAYAKEAGLMKKAIVSICIDADVKAAAQAVFAGLGTDLDTAINIFLRAAIREQGFPFRVTRAMPTKAAILQLKDAGYRQDNGSYVLPKEWDDEEDAVYDEF